MIALVLGLLGGLYVVQQTVYGPEAAVRGYFGALAERDAKTALSYLNSTETDERDPVSDPGSSVSMLTDAVLRGDGYQPPTDVEITSIGPPDGASADAGAGRFAEALVGFRLGEEKHTVRVTLVRREEVTYGLFREWRLSDAVSTVAVTGTALAPVAINGVEVRRPTDAPLGGVGVRVTVFPGRYSVSLADNKLLEAEELTVSVGSKSVQAVLEPQLKGSAREETEKQVTAHLDECADFTDLQPEGCPFSSYVYDTVTDVEWTIDEYPTIVVELSGGGYVGVRSVESGVASVTYKDSKGKKQDDETTFQVYGTVAATPDGVTFHPPR